MFPSPEILAKSYPAAKSQKRSREFERDGRASEAVFAADKGWMDGLCVCLSDYVFTQEPPNEPSTIRVLRHRHGGGGAPLDRPVDVQVVQE